MNHSRQLNTVRATAGLLSSALLMVLFASCSGGSVTPGANSAGSAKTEKALTNAERETAGLPLEGVLTLAQPGDTDAARSVPEKVRQGVAAYIKTHERDAEWKVCAARPVGKYLLLWIWFPKIMDGGVDVIYSMDDDQVVGTFLGGIRG
jgi:hypothetical protein